MIFNLEYYIQYCFYFSFADPLNYISGLHLNSSFADEITVAKINVNY
jgi:hypothetical protein